jgi:16S rRNA (cytosine967-C5)-methyltransferase
MWFATLGPEHARALMAFDNEPSELALRANTLVTDAPSLLRAIGGAQALAVPARTDTPSSPARTVSSSTAVFAHLDPDLPEALVLDGPFDVRSSRLWEQGAFVAQSRAAMHVARALAPQPGERVLDVCAAPGGKTTHLAALMDGRGEVVALERDRARADQLARTVTRLRAGNVRIVIADGAVPSERAADFDRVLVDPPCSGLGTLQARADLRWRATPQSLAAAARQAREILGASAQRLRPGGLLVYSTCTISPAENEHVIADFLDSHADFSLDDLGADLPAHAHPARTGGVGASSSAEPAAEIASRCVLTLPHRDRTAGFFIARLRRG